MGLLLVIFLLFQIYIRVRTTSLGHNHDMNSNEFNSNIFLENKSIYANSNRYNYGPVKVYMLGAIKTIGKRMGHLDFKSFHKDIAFTLGIIDCLIFFTIWHLFGLLSASLYISSPISVLISGYHSQHDNLAILFALIAWIFYLKSQKVKNHKYYFLSAIIFGISLATKHILYLFPVWIIFTKDKQGRNFLKKIKFAFIAYSTFFASFGIELIRHQAELKNTLKGIITNVFEYKSIYGRSFYVKFIELIFPKTLIDKYFNWIPILSGYTFISLIGVLVIGFLLSKKWGNNKIFLPLYLATIYATSPSLADQYLVIPLVASSVFYNSIEMIVFNIVSILYLFRGDTANIGRVQPFSIFLNIKNIRLPLFLWGIQHKFTLVSSQAIVLLFCIKFIFKVQLKYKKKSLFSAKKIAIYPLFNKLKSLSSKIIIKKTHVTILFYMVGIASLFSLLRIKKYPPSNKGINITSITYEKECTPNKDQIREIYNLCNDKYKCKYQVNLENITNKCKEEYKINWNCNFELDKIHLSYSTIPNPIINNQPVILRCY